MMEVDEDEDEQAGSRARDKHDGSDSGWDPARRRAHSLACRDKPRLTLSEKMEIVRRNSHADREHPEYRTQAQLAKMFGKSRAAISKIMRKGNVDKLSQKTDAGLDPDLKRQPQRDWSVHKARESCHLELEKRVTEYVHEIEQQTGQPCNAAQACKRAVEIAEELGVDTFKTKPGWCSWFDRLLGRQSPASDSSSISERPPTRAIDITDQLEGNGAKQQHLSVSPPSAPPDQTASSSRSSSHIAAAQMPMLMSSFHGDSHALGGATLVRPASQLSFFANIPPSMEVQGKLVVHATSCYCDGTPGELVPRPLRIVLDLNRCGLPLHGCAKLKEALSWAHQEEVLRSQARGLFVELKIYYVDCERDLVSLSSDHELGMAFQYCRRDQLLHSPSHSHLMQAGADAARFLHSPIHLEVYLCGSQSYEALQVAARHCLSLPARHCVSVPDAGAGHTAFSPYGLESPEVTRTEASTSATVPASQRIDLPSSKAPSAGGCGGAGQ